MKAALCKICNITSQYSNTDSNILVCCSRCGEYYITMEFDSDFKSRLSPKDISLVSGWLREHQGANVTEDLISQLKKSSISVYDKALKLLEWTAKNTQSPGQSVRGQRGQELT